jgi:mandelate racemase
MPLSSHLWPEISAQLLCCTTDGALARVRKLVEPGPRQPLCLEQGIAKLGGVLGSGVEWNEEAVKRFAA